MSYTDIKTEEEFKAIVESGDTIVVDYWAPWCGPCKSYSSIFEQVSDSVSGATFVKVNIDEHPGLTASQGVRGIPTTQVFKGGKLVQFKSGIINDKSLIALIEA